MQNNQHQHNSNKYNEDFQRNKQFKNDFMSIFVSRHNAVKVGRNGNILERDHYGEFNHNIVKNNIIDKNKIIKQDVQEDVLINFNLKNINIFNNQLFDFGVNDINRINHFNNFHQYLFKLNNIIYVISKPIFTRLGYFVSNMIINTLINSINKCDDIGFKIFDKLEMLKIISQENNNFIRYISYGKRIVNTPFINKIKCHPDLIKLPTINSPNLILEESSNNAHWCVGSLRGSEENSVKIEIRRSHVGKIFIGIGENLSRFDDFPGIYFNHGVNNYDAIRVSKYRSLTYKNPDNQVDQLFDSVTFLQNFPNDINNPNEKFVFHSTDVAYYMPQNLTLENFNYINRDRIIQYHTFNVFSKNIFNIDYKFATVKRIKNINAADNGTHLYYKPNGNEEPYEHPDVVIAGKIIDKELIEELFIKQTMTFDTNLNYSIYVYVLNCYQIIDEMSYITINITYDINNPGKLYLKSRYNNYINQYKIMKEINEYKDDRFKIGEYKIKEIPMSNYESENYEYFKKWYDGNDSKLIKDIYILKDTDKYKNGYYFFNDEIVFLKIFKNKKTDQYQLDELNKDQLFYSKYNVDIKINKVQMNVIMQMFRGMSIKAPTIKNSINSIINVAKEEWHIEMDYEYAYFLAVCAARYVAKMNQSILLEVEHNKEIYDDKLYQQKLPWQEQIKHVVSKYEEEAKDLVVVVDSVVNSTHVNNIIEAQKKDFLINIFDYIKYYFIIFYMYILFTYYKVKGFIYKNEPDELIFIKFYDDILTLVKNNYLYNTIGVVGKTIQNLFNKYKHHLTKSTAETYHKYISAIYSLIVRTNKIKMLTIMLLFVLILPMIAVFIICIDKLINYSFSIVFEDEMYNFIFFKHTSFVTKCVLLFIFIILNFFNEHFMSGVLKHVIFIIINLYGNTIFPEFKLLIMFIKMRLIHRCNLTLVLLLIWLTLLVSVNSQYTHYEYVRLIDFNPGSCTMNNHVDMYETLVLMWKNMDEYIKRENLTERLANKFKILDIRKPHDPHQKTNDQIFKQPLIQKGFKINGYNVLSNEPLKLHDCFFCEVEAVYRQVQSRVDYDDQIIKEYETFCHKLLDNLLDDKIAQIVDFNLDDYLSKLGPKRNEFEQGYLDYQNYQKLIKAFKMHVKIDEKIYMNYGKYKMKARNISAQNKRVKLLMGIVCELLMACIHSEPWCGPGSTNEEKCNIFEEWIQLIGPSEVGVLCADGSAFDSTQHRKIQEIVDVYCFNKIINKCSNILSKFGSIEAFKDVCNQESYTIYSKYITYKIQGTQMTGRMNTCLGNTLRSWTYVEFIKYKMKQERPWINIDNIKEMVNGDDQIIFMRKAHFDFYEQIAYKYVYAKEDVSQKHGLGQIAKIFDKYPEINGAEFLSCILLYREDTQQCLMVRKIERFLQMTPYTYNNKHSNVKKLRYINATLLVADALNILSVEDNLDVFTFYARKMYEIGINEQYQLRNYFMACPSLQKSYKKVLEEYNYINKHKGYYYKTKVNKNKDHYFDIKYYEFLNKNYNITSDDIREYFDILSKINVNNYLDYYQCHLVDKLMKVKDIKQYEKTMSEINKTKLDTRLNLKGDQVIAEVYTMKV